ncbi:MAG: rhomboid family intramembrane serine protease [Chloroflexi bacterium]|nr:rhomboid family intramembrane serine protease [Chloroflexota bacterium]
MADAEHPQEHRAAGEVDTSPPATSRLRIPGTALTWAIVGINVAVWLSMEASGGSMNSRVIVDFGAKVNALIAEGEYWRLIMPVFLHIGVVHLVFNTVGLLSFGRLVETTYGHVRFLVIYLVSGVAGSVLSYLMSPSPSAGASGAIFGIAGALAVFYAYNRRAHPASDQGQLGGIITVLAINAVYGVVQPGIDNWGHAGGLIGGVAAAVWLVPRVRVVHGFDGDVVGVRLERSPASGWIGPAIVIGAVALAVALAPGR